MNNFCARSHTTTVEILPRKKQREEDTLYQIHQYRRGGFTSIRTPLQNGFPSRILGLRLKFWGDGRTYKVLLSDGSLSGPMARTPSWQVDLLTKKLTEDDGAQVATVKLSSFVPSFGGSSALCPSRDQYQFNQTEMRELGLMLSLRLSDGRPNPSETFGEGIFNFSLFVESFELIFNEEEEGRKRRALGRRPRIFNEVPS